MEIYTEMLDDVTRRRATTARGTALRLATAAVCCCTEIEKGRLQDHNRPLSWVGDTGIEPVTSSV